MFPLKIPPKEKFNHSAYILKVTYIVHPQANNMITHSGFEGYHIRCLLLIGLSIRDQFIPHADKRHKNVTSSGFTPDVCMFSKHLSASSPNPFSA